MLIWILQFIVLAHGGIYLCTFGSCVDFSTMVACGDYAKPIRYGVCNVYVGRGGWFVACGSLVWYLVYKCHCSRL